LSTRLNKLLASRGVAARRKCDELIEAGHVMVNGRIVRTLGTQVDADHDHIKVKGKRIPGAPAHKYFLLNKPVGVISTMSDPEGRRSIKDMLPRGGPRLFPVGRLDADTSGILILTNDGEIAHKLMHPRYGVEKFYRVVVKRHPMPYQIEKLRRGVSFEKGVRSGPARVRVRTAVSRGSVLEIVLSEGRYRQVRKMCETVGLDVVALHRWGYGPVRLGELARGMWRELSAGELESLRATAARPKAELKIAPAISRRPRRPTVARSRANTPAGRKARTATREEEKRSPHGRATVKASRGRDSDRRTRSSAAPSSRSASPRSRRASPRSGTDTRSRSGAPAAGGRSSTPRGARTASRGPRTAGASPRGKRRSSWEGSRNEGASRRGSTSGGRGSASRGKPKARSKPRR
jgi:23S rRNA pseudouridine2605 synthase